MEQVFPFLVLGIGFIAVLTLVRVLARVLRLVVLIALLFLLGYFVVKGRLPFGPAKFHSKLVQTLHR